MLKYTPEEKIAVLDKERQDNLDKIVSLQNQITEKYSNIELYSNTIQIYQNQIVDMQNGISDLTINNEKIDEMILDYQSS